MAIRGAMLVVTKAQSFPHQLSFNLLLLIYIFLFYFVFLISSFVEQILAFALEPHGSKFCVIHGEPPTRISASFYAIKDKGNKVVKIGEAALLPFLANIWIMLYD